jgi:IS5 family transposase
MWSPRMGYPTDAGLLARAVAKLAATIGRVQAAGGASRTRSGAGAIRQLRAYRPAQTLVARRIAAGNSKPEALRVLKRHLADVQYAAMRADEQAASTTATLNTRRLTWELLIGSGAGRSCKPRQIIRKGFSSHIRVRY